MDWCVRGLTFSAVLVRVEECVGGQGNVVRFEEMGRCTPRRNVFCLGGA